MNITRRLSLYLTLMMGLAIIAVGGQATELETSFFDTELQKVRYASAYASASAFDEDKSTDDQYKWEAKGLDYTHKSPFKAFLLSLAIPGLGQYYYGSKIKPVAFLGIEVAGWVMRGRWNGQGDDWTTAYEDFHSQHWLRESYLDYVEYHWGVSSDSGIVQLTHQLPDDETQQFYEMTGKYDQFSWGWDDALLDNRDLLSYINSGDLPIISAEETTTPTSANRLEFESLRNEANNRYDKAKMAAYVIMFNHLISAFEAYIVTKKRNKDLSRTEQEFAGLQVRALMRSQYSRWDTPFVGMTYKF